MFLLLVVIQRHRRLEAQPLNARINPTKPARYTQDSRSQLMLMMKGSLAQVGFNELLDFVRRDYSASPDLSRLLLLFNAPDAAWRFI
jgi:hypothetical protein